MEGYSGREHVVLFEEVQAVEMNQPEGMLLYSPSEMRLATSPEICVQQQRRRPTRLFCLSLQRAFLSGLSNHAAIRWGQLT